MKWLRQVPTVIGLTVLWMLLVGQPGWPEFIAGAVAALLSGSVLAFSNGPRPVLRLRWLPRAAGPLLRVFPDTLRVLAAIVRGAFGRAPRGQFVIVRAPPGDEDDARIAAHVLGISLPPNSLVVDVPNEERGYLVHQLIETRPQRLEALP
ncbi:MAG: Na+/H+ antiporter subunit E [Myxococcaceae bacterium]